MIHSPKGDRFLTKEINRRLVLNVIKSSGPISRKDVADITGLSAATITGITAALIENGMVSETGEGQASSAGGRRPIFLQLNPQAGYVIGIKIRDEGIIGVLVDLDATILFRESSQFVIEGDNQAKLEPAMVHQAIIETIEAMLTASGISRQRILGIGVSINGLVDRTTGVSRFAPHFGWHNVAIGQPLAEHFKLPVYLSNDVKSLTLAQQWFGKGLNVDNFIEVAVGRGIGAGLVVQGQFYDGTLDAAGEFGHMVLVRDGLRCSCGKKGCLDTLSSAPAMLRQLRVALAQDEPTILASNPNPTLIDLAQAADQGDALANRILTEAGEWLGIGISYLLNIVSPRLVIINGEGVLAGPCYYKAMREAIAKNTFSQALVEQLSLVIEPIGDDEWARGAACVVLSELFISPMYQTITQTLRQ